ncbi:uncharacterized protein LOC114646145 [Erpetoichthys calabaricus]|uniref:Uncharacterized LOC114646145 n=1 Tax=Erpetoichthys calabaricus TaxID=27687 RepID=A0A8C4T0I4_ERPCA|nr:uncharacterized protein LOC114646145 [Erpetoichthys calabaricus]
MDEAVKYFSDHKDDVIKVMNRFLDGAEAVLEIVGETVPICSVAIAVIRFALDNQESSESEYVKNQLQKISDKLNDVSENLTDIRKEIEKLGMDIKFSEVEENIKGQFRKYMEILNEEPEYREKKVKRFKNHFSNTRGDGNLHELYEGVIGEGSIAILKTVLTYWEKNRRVVEDFCAHLKYLFVIGISALMVHTALENGDVSRQEKYWKEKMETVELKMKSAVEDCINNFAAQAKIDTQKFLKYGYSEDLADNLFSFLQKKYDWVYWAVRVYGQSDGWLTNLKLGRKYHSIVGESHFKFDDNCNVVVSYCVNPQPIDVRKIQQTFRESKKNRNMWKLAEHIHSEVPKCVIHAIRQNSKIYEKTNFPDDCYCHEQQKNCYLYVHSA